MNVPCGSIVEAKQYAGDPNTTVSLFGIVAEIGSPSKSRGTDYFLVLKIVDPSCSPERLPVNLFARCTAELPNVRANGDIIYLHKVLMRVHGGDTYCSFNKRSGSFALFEGKNVLGPPYQTSTGYQASYHDDTILLQLSDWLLSHTSEAGLDDKSLLVNSVEVGHVVDLVCKILHSRETAGDLLLFVWDGTDAPITNLETNLQIEEESPCPLCLEPLSWEVFREFPSAGTVLPVFAGNASKKLERLPDVSQWIKLCNIVFEIQVGMWKGNLQDDSNIRLLSSNDASVLRRERLYYDHTASISSHSQILNIPHLTRIYAAENLPLSTLRDSLSNQEDPHKLMCLVRVIAICPWPTSMFSSSAGEYVTIRVTLEDPTARIQAYIYWKDAEHFFGVKATSDQLPGKAKMLLGISEDSASRRPPYVVFGLKLYHTTSSAGVLMNYRVFGTSLIV